jgi:hypothetical protein
MHLHRWKQITARQAVTEICIHYQTAENILSIDPPSVSVIFTSFKALFDVVHIFYGFVFSIQEL